MSRRWITQGFGIASMSVLGALVAAFASCATNNEGEAVGEDASTSTLPEAAADAEADAERDSSCELPDAQCTGPVVPCESVSWCMESTPVTPRHALTAVWGTSRSDVWAVGSGGSIIHYDGSAWTQTPTNVPSTLFAIGGSGPHDIWVASSAEYLLHGSGYTNGTAEWTNEAPVGRTPVDIDRDTILSAVWVSSTSDVRLGTAVGDFGYPIRIMDPTFMYFGSGNQLAPLNVDDGGLRWRTIPGKGSVASIWGSSDDDVWMAVDKGGTERGLLLHGTGYTGPAPNPTLLADRGCVVGCYPGCTACAAVDDRFAWTSIDSQSKLAFRAIWGSSESDVWAVGEGGNIRRYQTGDPRFQRIASPTPHTLRAIWGSGPSDVWMVGDEGTILHFDGTTVSESTAQFPLGAKPHLRGVWGSGPSDVWIVGDGIVLHYTGRNPSHAEGGR
ncbi:hypothetical protein [Labilithrix luteola]|uniref:hypothetical protein n=1 Tax=Labilithrix luteola TaxID=1391654 RepID=UPI0011BA541F|nr:hypothetical protein [Labilithrix luteola]